MIRYYISISHWGMIDVTNAISYFSNGVPYAPSLPYHKYGITNLYIEKF